MVVAPGPFKGALGAADAAAAIARGLAGAGLETTEVPVADGGQGTLDALLGARGGRRRTVRVRDPLGREIDADLGLFDDDVAMVELAQAAGYERLAPSERDPERTSTYGAGQLILAALDEGAGEILIGVGGSATNDGGLGALRALGARLLDVGGRPLDGTGADLGLLASVDLSGLDRRLAATRLRIVADVDNPLCGPDGAAAVFGPQKGADPAAVERLDAGLARLASIMADHGVTGVGELPGAGAAGGAAAGFAGLAGAEIEAGAEVVLDAVDIDGALAGARLCVTGEGALDGQTAAGKAPAAVAARCRRAGVPCVALCGHLALSPAEAREMGFVAALAIGRGPCSLADALARTASDLEAVGGSVGGLVVAAGAPA